MYWSVSNFHFHFLKTFLRCMDWYQTSCRRKSQSFPWRKDLCLALLETSLYWGAGVRNIHLNHILAAQVIRCVEAFQKHGAFLWKCSLLRLNSINNIKCLFNHDKKLECYAWFISCVWIYLSLQIFNHWKNCYCFDLVMDDDSWTKSIALSVWMEKVQSLPRFKDNASKCHSTKNSLGLFQAREYQRTLEQFGIRNIKKINQSWSQLRLPNSYLSLFLRNFNEKNSNKKPVEVI